jgi:hypothetical protein
MPDVERENAGDRRRLLRENAEAQERVRRELDGLGPPPRPSPRQARSAASRLLAPRVKVEIAAMDTPHAHWTAQRMADAFESCGMTACVTTDEGSTWEGVRVISRTENALTAMMIQGAFRLAGIGALLTIHERAARDRVVVALGAEGVN